MRSRFWDQKRRGLDKAVHEGNEVVAVELAVVFVVPLGRFEGAHWSDMHAWLEDMRGGTQTGQADGRDGLAAGVVKTMQAML